MSLDADDDPLDPPVPDPNTFFDNPPTGAAPASFDAKNLITTEYGQPRRVDEIFVHVQENGRYYLTPFDFLGNERTPAQVLADMSYFNADIELAPSNVTNFTATLDSMADEPSETAFPLVDLSWTEPVSGGMVEDRYGGVEITLATAPAASTGQKGPEVVIVTVPRGTTSVKVRAEWGSKNWFKAYSYNASDATVKSSGVEAGPVTTNALQVNMNFTTTPQFINSLEPNGFFTVLTDDDDDGTPEGWILTSIGVISIDGSTVDVRPDIPGDQPAFVP